MKFVYKILLGTIIIMATAFGLSVMERKKLDLFI